MKRKEVILTVDHNASPTPTRAALQQVLSKELGINPQHIDIRNIYSHIGRQASRAKVFVWEQPKVLDLSQIKAEEKKAETSAQAV